ncbi:MULTISPECIES: hypothetical protein [Legionella]|uniref:Secreted protein n=1 Tax=Legionella resiliens TaxID=2905958 RepID=A0ABS8X161_9GAMM|nr:MULTISPECIES: hypothetical protein [unclassified Legionella]MCE0722556.1 hypothetical protein [Legionella sp. 9fVS26]MCE3531709.1 hypothetical protein [Legionella sp. 8cVS16]QLZ67734.1 hypothetical protein FOLKNPGA_00507 [Legionella sp. PC1000]
MKKLVISSLLTVLSTVALADSVIVTKTHTWKSVPITVNAEKHIYTVDQGSIVVPGSEFYYTYSGYRCLTEKTNIVGVNAVVYHAGITGGSDIYCYPE